MASDMVDKYLLHTEAQQLKERVDDSSASVNVTESAASEGVGRDIILE